MTEEDLDAPAEAVEGAVRIARRLRRSVEHFAGLPPPDADAVERFDAETQTECDAPFKRVESPIAQLQDQVWRRALAVEGATLRLDTRRERAEHMQRYGLLPPGEGFGDAARLRNRLSHGYPTDPALQARLLRDALALAPLLLDAVARAEGYLARRRAGPAEAPP